MMVMYENESSSPEPASVISFVFAIAKVFEGIKYVKFF